MYLTISIILIIITISLCISLTYFLINLIKNNTAYKAKIIEIQQYRNDTITDMITIAQAMEEINTYLQINNPEFVKWKKEKTK